MGYSILVGQHRPLINPATNAAIATASVTDPGGGSPPFPGGGSANARIQDDGSGHLECVGLSAGTITFDLESNGTVASHEITVTGAPFDWTLGDPT